MRIGRMMRGEDKDEDEDGEDGDEDENGGSSFQPNASTAEGLAPEATCYPCPARCPR